MSLQEASVQCHRIAPLNNSMALNHPTKTLVGGITTRNPILTNHRCIDLAAVIAIGIASRIHIETTHRSSIVDENRSSLSMSFSSTLSVDEHAACTAQNRHAYCTSCGIVQSMVSLDTAFTFSVGFKSVSTPSDSRLFKISRHWRASCLL